MATSRTKKRRSPFRVVLTWVRRLVLIAIGLGVLAIAVVLVVLHTDWGRDKLRAEIESQLQARFPGGAKLGAVEGSVLGTLVLRDLELDGRDTKPMVTVDKIAVSVSLPALLEAIVRVQSLDVDGVAVSIRPQPPAPPEPADAGDATPKAGAAARAWRIELPHVEVSNASVSVTTTPVPIVLEHVELGASFVMPRRRPMELQLGVHGQWRAHEMTAVVLATYGSGELSVPFASVTGAGVVVGAIDVHAGSAGIAGVVTAQVRVEAMKELAGVDVPGDIVAVVDGDGPQFGVDATMGESRVFARGTVDVDNRIARGIASVTSADLGPPTHDLVTGHGTVAMAVEASPQGVTGVVGVLGAVVDTEESRIELAIDATRARAEVVGTLQRGTSAHGSVTAEVVNTAGAYTLTRAHVLLVGRDVEMTRGTLYVDAQVRGALTPAPALTVDADIDGERLSYGAMSVAGLQAHLTGAGVPANPTGHVRVTASDLRQGAAVRIPQAMIDSTVAMGGDGSITVDNITHEVRSLQGTWSGSGGRVTVAPGASRIDVRGFKTGTTLAVKSTADAASAPIPDTGSAGSATPVPPPAPPAPPALAASRSAISIDTATYSPDTGDLAASVTATNVVLASALPDVPGVVDASASVTRRGGAWAGKVHVDGHALGAPGSPLRADATADVALANRRVTITARAANAQVGDATLTADIVGPSDPTDVPAWFRLDRKAIHRAELAVRVDSAPLHVEPVTGTLHGTIDVADGEVHGDLVADGVHAGPEVATIDLGIGPGAGDELAATVSANVSGVVLPQVLARVAIPPHVFDPASWRRLDRSALRGAVIQLDDTALDTPTLIALGIQTPYTAHVSATVDVGEGGTGALVDATVSQISGGPLAHPLDVHVTGGIDGDGAHAEVAVSDGPRALLSATAQSPMTIAIASRGLPAILAAAITGTLETPDLVAPDVLAIVGRKDATSGLLHAKVDVAGTIAAPTGTATISARGVVLAPPLAGREAPALEDLDLTAKWTGIAGELDITAHEQAGGQLRAHAAGRPDKLAQIDATFDASDFDVAPVAAFAPGTLAALTGTIQLATLHYDPQTAHVIGHAHLVGASLPLSSQLGTFREAKIDVEIAGDKVDANIDGKLGEGGAHGTATMMLSGPLPASVDLKLVLAKVSPLGALRPKVDATISGKLVRNSETGNWSGSVAVDDAHATVKLKFADDLLAVGAPDDMVFVDAPPTSALIKDIHIPEPSKPWLDVQIAIAPATFEATEPGSHAALGGILGVVHGTVEGNLELSYGDDGIGLEGQIVADRGDIELVGRRYDVEVAELDFDGPIYPKVNVQISHVFPDLTLTVGVTGRLPKDIQVEPTSDNSNYTGDQLYGILFGGDPGGDPANAAQDAATAAGAAVASSIGGRYVNQGLERAHVPIKIDVLRYTAATGTSSASFEVGKWLFGKLYLAYRQHLEALPTENINEGELQYYFQRHILLDTSVGDREYDSADVLYRLRW
jgi:hypothetical protein|nr:translocation/assembly module TamB domain-containing protein [Kofleriaceae bacterium]